MWVRRRSASDVYMCTLLRFRRMRCSSMYGKPIWRGGLGLRAAPKNESVRVPYTLDVIDSIEKLLRWLTSSSWLP